MNVFASIDTVVVLLLVADIVDTDFLAIAHIVGSFFVGARLAAIVVLVVVRLVTVAVLHVVVVDLVFVCIAAVVVVLAVHGLV